jgi:hypothetical protein
MTSVTFDTHAFIKELEDKGFTSAQAEGINEAFKDAFQVADVATKSDIEKLELKLRAEIAPLKWMYVATKSDIEKLELKLREEIAPLKWMCGVCAAGILFLVIKAFF